VVGDGVTSTERFDGGCLCGAVRFAVTPPTKWCAHCHCSLCRRAHGAGYVTWVGVPASQFRMLSGDEVLRDYASSPQALRGFCAACGTTLFFRSTRWPDEVHVARAAFDGPIDREPAAHVFYDERVPWAPVDDALPRCGGPSGTEPLPADA
jgi:hypothetical protein